jgi:signal transduction histidine kinase
MKLDVRTIMFVIIIGSMLMSAGLFSVSRGYLGQVRGVFRWAVATAIQAAGWIIVGVLRGVIPDVLSIVLGNGLIQLSFAMYLIILADFNKKPIRSELVYAGVAIVCVLLFYFSAIDPDLTARNFILSVSGAVLTLTSVYILLLKRDSQLGSHTFMICLFAISGSFMTFRALYYLTVDQKLSQAAYASSTVNDVSYLVFFIFSSMFTFGFTLMCNEYYILQQKKAEEESKTGHQLLAKLLAQVPGAIYQYQLFPDGRMSFPFASQGIQDIYEVTPEQVREDAQSVFAHLHPDDTDAIMKSINVSARDMQPWHLEYRVVLPKQGLRWRLGQAQPERLADGSILWHGFIADITERALAEAKHKQLEDELRVSYTALTFNENRLRRLMNSSLIGIVQGDASGRLKEANDVLLHMIGEQRKALIDGGLNWFNLTPASAVTSQLQAIRDVARDEVIAPFETEIRNSDGIALPIMLGLSKLEGSQDEWVGFVLDLREQKRIDKLKSEFISVVSHELRTPLTSIKGSLGLLEGGVAGELPAKALQLIKIAHKNSLRLVNLVNDILDMEKLASGKMNMNLQRVDLVHLAVQAIEASASYAESFKVRYHIAEHPEQAFVIGDVDRLMQVFANLLSNAAKFSPAGETVELRIIPHENQFVVEIEDHGSGIPFAFRERIFGKFAQADGTTTRQLEGAGLGLNITKTLIKNMGGDIGFRSEEHIATVFWFALPIIEEQT